MPTNDYSKNIVYLSKEQYQELITNETLIVNGQTITYNDNDIYVTPQAEPITDVKINGTSIGSNGIANVPIASSSTLGVVKADLQHGIEIASNGNVWTIPASDNIVKAGADTYRVIAPLRQHMSTFYGLAKAAGSDEKNSSLPVGSYTDAAKGAIQNMLGITDLIASPEASTATAAHALNSTFMMNGKLHRATAAIAIGDAVEVGTNCEVVKADEVFVKKTDYANGGNYGIVRANASYGTSVSNGHMQISSANSVLIKSGYNNVTGDFKPIVVNHQHEAVFYGLAKAAGSDEKDSELPLGTYSDNAKTAIRSLIGAAAASSAVTDVQVNGTSVVQNGVANVPLGSSSAPGVLMASGNGIGITNGYIQISAATSAQIKAGTGQSAPICVSRQNEAIYYGLSKLAGVDLANETVTVGTYPETSKAAIRSLIGATSSNVIAVQDEQPTDTDTKVWLPETEAQGVQVPTYEEFQTLDNSTVKKTDYATTSAYGIVKPGNGLLINSSNVLSIATATVEQCKQQTGSTGYQPITVWNQHAAAFYGLATAAGDTTQSASSNTIGTYTNDAKAAIQTMLGVPGDVQVNGTSVVSNGVANIPIATTSDFGMVKLGGGLTKDGNNALVTDYASDDVIKSGNGNRRPITPAYEHKAAFYGLAKAAGDTTQSASSNAVGTYTDSAKASIKSMLGIIDGSTSTVDVTGTTPTITAIENTRYTCGEVSTLSFTPSASGICIVRFTSGSTATVLTVPNTVKFPEWFDVSTLETDTIYEMCITDGIYGAVMSWVL